MYRTRPGWRVSKAEAEVLGRAWEALEQKLGYPPSAEDVVIEAIDPASPFHKHFEWDDSVAAHQYRITQALYLLRSIEVVLPEFDNVAIRGIIPIGDNTGGFISTKTAIRSRPDIIERQLKRLRTEAESIEREYSAWEHILDHDAARAFIRSARELVRS